MSNPTAAAAVVLDRDSAIVKDVLNQIRADLRAPGRYAAYVTAYGVTRESVKAHAVALATAIYPKAGPQTVKDDNGVQRRTPFGNAVQAAGNGLRAALPKADATSSIALLTKAGREATLAEVTAAWEAAQQ